LICSGLICSCLCVCVFACLCFVFSRGCFISLLPHASGHRPAHGMLHKMLGAELMFHTLERDELYPSLSAPRTYKGSEGHDSNSMVMIIPEGSIMISVVRQGDTLYIQKTSAGVSTWHVNVLLHSHSFPEDSIVHAMLYADKCQNYTLGIFDMSRLNSRFLHEHAPLQRHVLLRESMQEHQIQDLQVKFLWVGYEKDCLKALKNRNMISGMNFHVKCIGRLPENSKQDSFVKMLPPINIP
jgi:hypothetical protein